MTRTDDEKAAAVEPLESKASEGVAAFAEALAKKSSPDEDVEAYMKSFILPVLTPALEQLLQVAASKGELHLDKSGKAPGSAESGERPIKKTATADSQAKEEAPEGEKRKLKKKSKTKTMDAEKEKEGAEKEKPPEDGSNPLEAGESTETEPPPEKFNPLLWLSDRFREQAKGRQYKEHFEERMEERRRKRAEEAAAKQAAEEEAARLAAEEEAAARTGPPPGEGSLAESVGKGLDMKQNQAWIDETLKFHNELRAKHGSPPLEWDDECASKSQLAADACAAKNTLFHSHCHEYGHGQNAFGGTPGHYGAQDAVEAWYSEYTDPGYSSPGAPGTGHFTQVVWLATTHVGMSCDMAGKGFIVANYKPAGNMNPPDPHYIRNVLPLGTAMQERPKT